MLFRKLFARSELTLPLVTLPDGERVYAIGDVHGSLDCFERLLARIDDDNHSRARAETILILLGDLIDRGPDSRGVIARAMQLCAERRCIVLMGNHEEVLLHAWDGDKRASALFDRIGGCETMMSYGVDPVDYEQCDLEALTTLIGDVIPAEHIAFIRSFGERHQRGDYLFVHAGIRPGIAIDEQETADLRWIRGEFLDDPRDHGVVVVHGHSITPAIDERPNRIGIDTGAYASGRLTALGLEGSERWFLSS